MNFGDHSNEERSGEASRPSREGPTFYTEQVEAVYQSARVSIAGNLLNATVLVFVQWNVISHTILLPWLVFNYGIALFRYISIHRYKRSPESLPLGRWRNRFIAGLVLSLAPWAAAGVFLFPLDSIAHQVFLAFALGGTAAGSGGILFSHRRSLLAIYSPDLDSDHGPIFRPGRTDRHDDGGPALPLHEPPADHGNPDARLDCIVTEIAA